MFLGATFFLWLVLTCQGISGMQSNESNSPSSTSSGNNTNERAKMQNKGNYTNDVIFKREIEGGLLNSTESEANALNETLTEADYLRWIKDSVMPWTWVLIASHCVVFVVGLIGNTLVCIAVYRNRSMRTVTNYFITNLAVADFLVILVCLPPSVIWDVTMTWFFGNGMCKVVLYLQTVSVTVSVLTLTFISVERWYAICFPLKFKSTTGRARTAILIIWILALLFDIPELIVYHTQRRVPIDTIYFTQCEPSWSDNTETSWILLKMALLYAVPLTFMTITYWQIIRVLWKSGCVSQHDLDIVGNTQLFTFSMASNASTRGQLRSRKKAAKMLVSVVVMFALCFFPVHLLSVLRMTMRLSNSDLNRAFASLSHWLCYLNSAVNPVIYNFMSGKFRKEFKRSIVCTRKSAKPRRYQLSSFKVGSLTSRTFSRTSCTAKRKDTLSTKFTD